MNYFQKKSDGLPHSTKVEFAMTNENTVVIARSNTSLLRHSSLLLRRLDEVIYGNLSLHNFFKSLCEIIFQNQYRKRSLVKIHLRSAELTAEAEASVDWLRY